MIVIIILCFNNYFLYGRSQNFSSGSNPYKNTSGQRSISHIALCTLLRQASFYAPKTLRISTHIFPFMEASFRFLVKIEPSICYEDPLEHLALWLDDEIEGRPTLGTYTRGHIEIYLWNLKRARHATIANVIAHEFCHHCVANATRTTKDDHWAIERLGL